MRPIIAIVLLTLSCGGVAAEGDVAAPAWAPQNATSDFQLGGATTRAAIAPNTINLDEMPTRTRLLIPRSTKSSPQRRRETILGAATLFMGEALDGGREVVEMGTFLSRGQSRAGVSITYLEQASQVSRSEVFFDYSLTENFSVGLSGILNAEIFADETVPQLGLSAEYSTEGGAFLQGGVADAAEYDPVVGLSIGLRF